MIFTVPNALASGGLVHHALSVSLAPQTGSIRAVDVITLAAPTAQIDFRLHAALQPRLVPASAGRITSLGDPHAPHLRRYRVNLVRPGRSITLEYAGTLTASDSLTAGHLSSAGVFLHRWAGWYPDTGHPLHSFSLQVEPPPGWRLISQGHGHAGGESGDGGSYGTASWTETQPQEDLYLVGGPLQRYVRTGGAVTAEVYLRTGSEPQLAQTYLDATERYVARYSRMLGTYPYTKFAVVENFWETGYGMPSFTLLGSRVMRLPFIVHTSHAHEIVHNWWGNGVFVDPDGGNWSEGLTAYLADHLQREIRGEGAVHRRDALQKYRNYVDSATDFPLTEFVAKHGHASEAVGYNKTLMMFHMLRRRLGDDVFLRGLRSFYQRYKFQHAGYAELEREFEQVSGKSLAAFFAQWTRRPGAPALAIDQAVVSDHTDGYRLTLSLEQVQAAPVFELQVPVFVQTEDGVEYWRFAMHDKLQTRELILTSRPLRLRVDPAFDLFRRIHPSEIPASLGELLGGTAATVVTTDRYEAAQAQLFVERLGASRVVNADDLQALPDEGPVWLFGWDNKWVSHLRSALPIERWSEHEVVLNGETWSRDRHCVVVTARVDGRGVAWVGCDLLAALPGLARKLPHYGKYSYLAFAGDTPDNRLKGRWPVGDSVMEWLLEPAANLPPFVLPAAPVLLAP